MSTRVEKRLAWVWLLLSAITLASAAAALFAGRSPIQLGTVATGVILLVSLFKVRLILMEFMELRHAPVLLRRLADLWLGITALALLLPYFATAGIGA